ncbi:MAG: ABC transporter permease [Clostridia bacterium]
MEFEGLKPNLSEKNTKQKNKSVVESVKEVINEIRENCQRIIRISLFDYKLLNKDSYLGAGWNLLNPLIQIGTYWFVFGIGIRSGSPVNGHPFLIWMLCGLIPWFFISTCITQGASSIYAKARLMLTLKYPISTMPLSTILVAFYQHIAVLGILVLLLFVHGYFTNLYWINILYYFVYEFAFLVSLAMVTSVLTMIARDFQKLINSLIRLLFYLTPILWTIENLPITVQKIFQLNPVLYIVSGFRDSLLYDISIFEHLDKMVFFWILNLILFAIGCKLQVKFRDKFIDML